MRSSSIPSDKSLDGTTLNQETCVKPYHLPTRYHKVRNEAEKSTTTLHFTNKFLPENSRIFIRLHFYPHNKLLIYVDLPVTYENLIQRITQKAKLCQGWAWRNRYPCVSYIDTNGSECLITPESDLTSILSRATPTPLYPITHLNVC
ncbi:hypothetical protein K435DRAFT_780698 [Dendrothele bispora CBS 962.96]|uniref:PB1 domain-containing protein n=1 Tax=Dendrothele bispora (strain CBS 962.96) TaxID=1314807 RepID=A0A4S8LQ30_DENBC|nr:hypothetical protein K435DRAFT_780698 [Dendrothele bispora CBS 962.96]